MPGHATSCWIHSPHTDPGVKVGNMAKKPTPGPRTIGNKCTCPRPGRPDGDAGPSGDKDQDGDGDGDDDGNQKEPRPHARMINGSGFYKPKPDKPKKPKNVVVAGMLMYTPMRAPPPPPSCASGGSGVSVDDGSSEGRRDIKSMSTLQRMLTPPVSDTDLPSKKLPYGDFRVFMSKGSSKTGRATDHVRRGAHGWIKHPPFPNDHPDPAKQPSKGAKHVARQEHSGGNSLPCIVETGSDDDSDSDKPKGGAKSPDNTLTAPTPPPSGDDSDRDIQDDPVQDSDTKDAADLARFRQMLTPPVADDESPPKKQPSEPVQVFMSNRHGKKEPNKSLKGRAVLRLPPFTPNPPNPDKEVKNPWLSATDKKKQKEAQKQKQKEKPCCDQSARPYTVSDNDADKEDNGVNLPVSSGTRSSSSSKNQKFFTPPVTPNRPITRSRSKQLADEATREQTTDDKYLASPSISPPSVKRKRHEGRSSQPTSPVSPLSHRPLKRLRGSPGNSPLVSPNPRPTKRQRRHQRDPEE